MVIAGILLEFFNFSKWFLVSRKRITSNCLVGLVEFDKDIKQRKKELRKIRLKVIEKVIVILLQFLIKALTFLFAVLIMQTYNLGYLFAICFGMMIGNLVFGLIQDTIVIKKVKRERKYF